MNPIEPSVSSLFSDSIEFVKKNTRSLMPAYIATTVIFLGLGILKQVVVGPSGENNLFVGLVEFLFYTFLTIWLFVDIVEILRPGHYQGLNALSFLYLCFRYILNSLLYGLWVLLGFCMLVIPGLIFIVRYIFVADLSIFDIDSDESLFQRSKKMTKNHFMMISWVLSILALLGMISFLMDYILVGMKMPVLSIALKPVDSLFFLFSRIVNVHMLLTFLAPKTHIES